MRRLPEGPNGRQTGNGLPSSSNSIRPLRFGGFGVVRFLLTWWNSSDRYGSMPLPTPC